MWMWDIMVRNKYRSYDDFIWWSMQHMMTSTLPPLLRKKKYKVGKSCPENGRFLLKGHPSGTWPRSRRRHSIVSDLKQLRISISLAQDRYGWMTVAEQAKSSYMHLLHQRRRNKNANVCIKKCEYKIIQYLPVSYTHLDVYKRQHLL